MTRPYAAAAAALLLAGLFTACGNDGDSDKPPDAEPAAVTTGPSYALGGTIHRTGAASIDSPGPVQAFVETRDGAVWGTRGREGLLRRR